MTAVARGHWPRGKRRNDTDAADMIRRLCDEFSAAAVSRMAGVSPRTVSRWARGEDWCRLEIINRIIDRLYPLSRGSGPIYRQSMAIDGNTRVGGVSDYSRRAARGWRSSYKGENDMFGKWTIENIEDIRRELIRCEDQARVHISRSCVCDRFAFHGVPAGSVDVLIDQRILMHSEGRDSSLVLERSQKTGKYDDRVRDRWLVRCMHPDNVEQLGLQAAECFLSASPRVMSVRILAAGAVASTADYDRLPPIDSSYDQHRCVKRNWTRYFGHLSWDHQVEPRLSEFVPVEITDRTTLNEVNIRASRWLADLSYELGFRRVVSDAAHRNQLPLWIRDDQLAVDAAEDELYDLQDQLS